MKIRLLFIGVVIPLGMVGRPLWRRRLSLGRSRSDTYWRRRDGRPIGPDDLRRSA